MSSLAEELGCDASDITQIVRRLEALGLVARDTDLQRSPGQDRRADPTGR